MRLMLLLVLSIWGLMVAPVSAGQVISSSRGNLYPVPLLKSGQETEKDKKTSLKPLFCGQFFVIKDGKLWPGKGRAAIVSFESGYGSELERESWGMDRNEVLVMLEERESPMITDIGPLYAGDPIQHHPVLRISKSDFEKAKPCIPEHYLEDAKPAPTT